MNPSRSLDAITKQFMTNSEMKDLPSHQRKFILNQFKKLYSQQMSKVIIEINRKNQVKNNKTEIQEKQQNEIKSIQLNLFKKMQEHDQKRQKAFSKKVGHFKMLDENWKQKIEQIHRQKKQENRQSLQKAVQFRKQAETFWNENKKRNKSTFSESKIQTLESEDRTIKVQIENSNRLAIPQGHHFYQNKRKSQSKNQLSSVSNSLLPIIQTKNNYLNRTQKKINKKTMMHNSFHKFVDDKTIQEHIEKSKYLNNEKEELVLHKALQKLRMIEQKRQKCKQDRQKSVRQTKEKRSLRQDAVAYAQRRKKNEKLQMQVRTAQDRRTERNLNSESDKNEHSRIKSGTLNDTSLNESIIRHRQIKEQLQEQEFNERGQILKTNLLKQKKGKMLRLVKQTISKMRKQALNDF